MSFSEVRPEIRPTILPTRAADMPGTNLPTSQPNAAQPSRHPSPEFRSVRDRYSLLPIAIVFNDCEPIAEHEVF